MMPAAPFAGANGQGGRTMNEHAARQTPPSISLIVTVQRDETPVAGLFAELAELETSGAADLEVIVLPFAGRARVEEAAAALPGARVLGIAPGQDMALALTEAFHLARNDIVMTMAAEQGYAADAIPALADALAGGAELAIASRRLTPGPGGNAERLWDRLRRLAIRMTSLPFTRASDPESMFFAFRREALQSAAPFSPVGPIIAVEAIVKCGFSQTAEVPVSAAPPRQLNLRERLAHRLGYIRYLRRLFIFRYGDWAHFGQFAAVGTAGTVVTLVALTVFLYLGLPLEASVAAAIGVAMLNNFLLNRRFSFSYAREGPFFRQLAGFVAASSLGAVLNFMTVLAIVRLVPALEPMPQVAAPFGILVGLVSNYLLSRYLVFAKPHA